MARVPVWIDSYSVEIDPLHKRLFFKVSTIVGDGSNLVDLIESIHVSDCLFELYLGLSYCHCLWRRRSRCLFADAFWDFVLFIGFGSPLLLTHLLI